MIQKYKIRPVTIEAIQFYFTEQCLNELKDWNLDFIVDRNYRNLPVIRISTLFGNRIVMDGDYIIKLGTGKYEVMDTKTFIDRYERAE